ncbi:MAG: hypothetical protein ABJB22_02790 [Verrucomicrobiota bacterium]
MKWLAAGLTCVNFSTVSGLLLGLAAGGLSRTVAFVAICVGLVAGLIALATVPGPHLDKTPVGKSNKYRNLWLWFTAACFAIFAFRCFCWLLYIDGDQFKIQSPHNLGDLALHLTYIKEFANGVALWPDNPIFLFGKMRYPAGTDLFNALLTCLGLNVIRGLIWTGLLGSLATFCALRFWGGTFTVAGFLFNGGLVGFHVLQTFAWLDYQGAQWIAWKSIPLTMLVTQRGLLYAIPAGLLLLCQWRAKYFGPESEPAGSRGAKAPPTLFPFWVELSLYASMPLFHIHTFLALSIVLGFWFLIGDWPARKQLLLLAGGAFLPATFFMWLVTDHFGARSMISWHPGWASTNPDFAAPFPGFWLVNFGIFLPLAALLIAFCVWRAWKKHKRALLRDPVLAFVLPATAIFVFACLFRTAVWDWDNIKLIIWAYLILLPFLWRELIAFWPAPIRVAICFSLFGSGFVSLFGGLAAGKGGYGLANRTEVDAIGVDLRKFPIEARFAAYPTYNHPLLLNGRKIVLGYDGHLFSQGFDYGKPLAQLKSLMLGAPDWKEAARQLGVRYLFWGSEEKMNYGASTRPWEKFSRIVMTRSWGTIYDLEQTDSAAR